MGLNPTSPQNQGLAGLLGKPTRRKERVSALDAKRLPQDLEASVRFVLDLDDAAVPVVHQAAGDGSNAAINYPGIAEHLQQAVASQDCDTNSFHPAGHATPTAASAGEAAAAGAASAALNGRLGPPLVVMSEARGGPTVEGGLSALGRSSFSTVRGNVCVYKGKWMYEVQLGSSGIIQLGWTALSARYTSEEGVGDSNDSYAYDGKRRRKWNVTAAPYGDAWTAGDVIGCAIDMDAGTISYYRNGMDQGVAFDYVRRRVAGAAYFPGASLSVGERCEFNFGARPLRYPMEGYAALEAPPPPAQLRAASYLSACLLRLAELQSQHAQQTEQAQQAQQVEQHRWRIEASSATPAGPSDPGSPHRSPAAATAPAGLGVTAQAVRAQASPGPAWGLPSSPRGLGAAEELLSPLGEGGAGEKAPAASPEAPAQVLALEDAAAAADGEGVVEPSAAAAPSAPWVLPRTVLAPALGQDEAVLLASLLAAHLGPLCVAEPYAVCAGLLPKLQEALEAGRPCLLGLLDLLEAALEEHELHALQRLVVQDCGQRVRGCVWDRAELPASQAAVALQLWEALLENDIWRRRWLTSREWMGEMEALLTVRQPTSGEGRPLTNSQAKLGNAAENQPADLEVLFAGVGAPASGREELGDGGQPRAQGLEDLAAVEAALDQVEEVQAAILLRLWRQAGPLDLAHPLKGQPAPWKACCAPPVGAGIGSVASSEAGPGKAGEGGGQGGGEAPNGLQEGERAQQAAQRTQQGSSQAAELGVSDVQGGGLTDPEGGSDGAGAGRGEVAAASLADTSIAAGPSGAAVPDHTSTQAALPAAPVTAGTGAADGPGPRPRYDPLGLGRPPSRAGTAAREAAPAGRSASGSEAVSSALPPVPRPPPQQQQPTAAPAGAVPAVLAEGDCVRWLVAWLVHKNRAARRDMPPPGLSDSTVLTSLFFATLRLLRSMLDTAHIQGQPFRFAAHMWLQGLLTPRDLPKTQQQSLAAQDLYDDMPRLGGTLGHLGKAHRPAPAEMAAAVHLEVPAGPAREAWSSEAPPAVQLFDPAAVVDSWLLDRLMALHHLGVSQQLRAAFGHLQTIDSAAASVEELTTRLRLAEAAVQQAGAQAGSGGEVAPEPAPGTERGAPAATLATGATAAAPAAAAAAATSGAPAAAGSAQSEEAAVLRHALAEQQQRVVEAAWLLSEWKQEATLGLSTLVCRLLAAVSEAGEGVLLRYVPEMYLEATLDMMHAVHRAEPCVDDAAGLLRRGVDVCLAFLVAHMAEERIANPDVRSMPLQTVWVLVQQEEGFVLYLRRVLPAASMLGASGAVVVDRCVVKKEWLGVLASHPACRAGLLPGLLRLFVQDRYWVQVGNVLLLLVEGTGFMQLSASERGPVWHAGVSELRRLLGRALADDPALAAAFLNHLFSSASWAATEMVVALEELRGVWEAGRGSSLALQPGPAAALRRASVTVELCSSLLRLLEFTAGLSPGLFLCGSPLNMTRLCLCPAGLSPSLFLCGNLLNMTRLVEVVGFALPQLTQGRAAADGMDQLEAAMQEVMVDRHHVSWGPSDTPSRRDLLKPLAGVLVNLWAAESQQSIPAAQAWDFGSPRGLAPRPPATPRPTPSQSAASVAALATAAGASQAVPAAAAAASTAAGEELMAQAMEAAGAPGIGEAAAGSSGASASAAVAAAAAGQEMGPVANSLVLALARREGVEDSHLNALLAMDWGQTLPQDDAGSRDVASTLPPAPAIGLHDGTLDLGGGGSRCSSSGPSGCGDASPLAGDKAGAACYVEQARLLREVVEAVQTKRGKLEAAAAERRTAASVGESKDVEIPHEFLDPILMTIMQEPVILPDSRITVDRATIERHLLSSGTDPFSRAPLAASQLQPDEALGARIREWMGAHGEDAALLSPH
ncbi:hypothetical protein N2152v2_003729 [Parachlorella kessleri]